MTQLQHGAAYARARLVEAECSGRQRDGRDWVWVHRALLAIIRWVWPEPLSSESPTPYIDAPPKRWPDGEPSQRWPDR